MGELGVLCSGYDLCSLGPTEGEFQTLQPGDVVLWPGRRPALLRGEGPTGAGIPDTGPDLSGRC